MTQKLWLCRRLSVQRHWKANLALRSCFVIRWKDRWGQWLTIGHCCCLLWLTLRMWDLHLHDCILTGCGAVLGTGCKGIVIWDDTVGPYVFSSSLREQILDFLIQLEYKRPFLLLMHKPEQIPGCPWTVLKSSNLCSPMPSCLLPGRNHPFNTLEVEPPR